MGITEMWRLQQTLCKWSAFLDYQIAVIQLAQVLGITNFATMHSEMLILTANANRHGKHADGSKYDSFQNLCDWINNSGSAELYAKCGQTHWKSKNSGYDLISSILFFIFCGFERD